MKLMMLLVLLSFSQVGFSSSSKENAEPEQWISAEKSGKEVYQKFLDITATDLEATFTDVEALILTNTVKLLQKQGFKPIKSLESWDMYSSFHYKNSNLEYCGMGLSTEKCYYKIKVTFNRLGKPMYRPQYIITVNYKSWTWKGTEYYEIDSYNVISTHAGVPVPVPGMSSSNLDGSE